MHVAVNTSRRVNKSGVGVEYRSVLLRTSYREAGKVKHETLANLSALPVSAVETLRASLAGKTMVESGTALAGLRKHKRAELLDVTEKRLKTIHKAVTAGRLKDAGKTGVRVGKTLGKTTWPSTSPWPSPTLP